VVCHLFATLLLIGGTSYAEVRLESNSIGGNSLGGIYSQLLSIIPHSCYALNKFGLMMDWAKANL